jgi:hypothetical protein
MKDVYAAVFRRYCQLVGHANDDPADPLVRDFYERLGAYEQLLTEKKSIKARPEAAFCCQDLRQ